MNADDLKSILNQQLAGCEVKVDVDGSHVNVIIIGDIFKGKKAVQRQQIVYSVLQEHIVSGVIHAVNMKTYSTQEWKQLT